MDVTLKNLVDFYGVFVNEKTYGERQMGLIKLWNFSVLEYMNASKITVEVG